MLLRLYYDNAAAPRCLLPRNAESFFLKAAESLGVRVRVTGQLLPDGLIILPFPLVHVVPKYSVY